MLSMCWDTQSIFTERPTRNGSQQLPPGRTTRGWGWGGREADIFSYKAFGCFEFLFKSYACGFCVYVCVCFLRKKEKEEAFFPKLAPWRDILCCSLSERFRLKSVRALDSDSLGSNLGCLTLKLSQATSLSRNFSLL